MGRSAGTRSAVGVRAALLACALLAALVPSAAGGDADSAAGARKRDSFDAVDRKADGVIERGERGAALRARLFRAEAPAAATQLAAQRRAERARAGSAPRTRTWDAAISRSCGLRRRRQRRGSEPAAWRRRIRTPAARRRRASASATST